MEAVLEDANANAILVMNCPTALASSTDAAEAVIGAVERHKHNSGVPPILTNWLGAAAADEARASSRRRTSPPTSPRATRSKASASFGNTRRAQEALMRTPPREADLSDINSEAARAAMAAAAKEGRALLTEPEAKAVLRAYGIPTVPTRVAATPQEVEATASELLEHAPALAVKVLSEDISHKSDVGGVRLGLQSPADAREAAEDIKSRVAKSRPDARLEGFTVQPMIVRPNAHELLLGVSEDRLFGPVILFGAGGVATEVVRDTAVALPPLDVELARDLMRQTRIYNLLKGYRDRPPADLEAIADALVRLSQLVVDSRRCVSSTSIRCSPTRGGSSRSTPASASTLRRSPCRGQIRGSRSGPTQINGRLRSRPRNGLPVLIRPIRPADEPILAAFQAKLSPEDIRFRFLAPRKEFSHKTNARFTQIDYARAMAFVALSMDQTEMWGVARLAADPDYVSAEYAVIVRSDLKGRGLGWTLMHHLIRYAESEGLRDLHGDVLAANERMLKMCRELGFEIEADPEDLALRKVRLKLPLEKMA